MSRAPIVARLSDRATVIEVHDQLYLRLDAEGRWTAFGEGGALFRRTVDGRVVRPVGSGFESCSPAEADTVDDWVARRAGELMEALTESRDADVEWLGDREGLLDRLKHAACTSPLDRLRHREQARTAR